MAGVDGLIKPSKPGMVRVQGLVLRTCAIEKVEIEAGWYRAGSLQQAGKMHV